MVTVKNILLSLLKVLLKFYYRSLNIDEDEK